MRFENSEITIRNIPILQLTDDFLSGFERFQETKTVWVNDPSNLYTKESFFIDDWNEEKKILVVNDLQTCLYYGGFLIAAYQSLHLVGFGCIDGNLVGNHKEYLELVYLHVTRPLRGFGIGKKLFIECCNHAREVNAKKLYIDSHP